MRYRLFIAALLITGMAIFRIHYVSAQQIPSEETTYSDDFSRYTPGSPPSGWLLRGAEQVIPTVKDVGGSGPSYRLVDFPEVPWQYWGRTLLKDGLIPHAPYTVTVKLNFRNKVADGAGLTIAWNDANGNRIEIIPNVYHNEIVPSVTYKGPIQSNASWRTDVEYIPISPFTNYWLRVEVKDDRPGQGQLSVLWSIDGTNFIQVKSATGLQDLRGLVGVSTVGPHLPHVYFDDFVVSAPTEGSVRLSKKPDGKAPNLIVLVHGCCTDAADLSEWNNLADTIRKALMKSQPATTWEIVVWDWHKNEKTGDDQTPVPPIWDLDNYKDYADIAYTYASLEGQKLADTINQYPIYEYIHLIGHSAGAKLIDQAAKWLAVDKRRKNMGKPFIFLTFLDAYTPNNDNYGSLPNEYLEHFSEQYVDIGLLYTDAILTQAYNFDITDWQPVAVDDKKDNGHQWPRYWYERSITSSGFKYGYPLSREGGYERLNELAIKYPPGKPACKLVDKTVDCYAPPSPALGPTPPRP